MKDSTNPQIFNTRDLTLNSTNQLELNGFRLSIFHQTGDPVNANRIRVSNEHIKVEFLPSKGISISQAWIKGQDIFWEAPIGLPDTENLDLWSDEIRINGEPARGFTFLKTLVGGLEFYGLKNWGMPHTIDGKTEPLHGETSNIPVDEIEFGTDNAERCWIQASFLYRSFKGDTTLPWYQRGEAIFKVTRKVIIPASGKELLVEDSILNVSDLKQRPDWGYHITLRPEDGARLLVPSKIVQERGGNAIPADIETWREAEDPSRRTETGIIHKDLMISPSERGPGNVISVLEYPGGTGLELSVPPSPYFQTWFCNGGRGSKEFTDANGESILWKNWDGMGLEIGSSALDHDGNIDETVPYEPDLDTGSEMTIPLKIRWLDKEELAELTRKITGYNSSRIPE